MSFNSSDGAVSNGFVGEDCNAVADLRAALESAVVGGEPAVPKGHAPTIADWTIPAKSPRAKTRHFGDYELLEEIARGGMGIVFKARHTKINRLVALKMILAGELASSDDVLRFHIEAEAAAKLNHANIVPIYEVGQIDGQHYFTMRLIVGESLAERIARGPLEPCRAAALLHCIAEAVQHAHDHGVIHRDLKPDNILMDAEGRPHVTDFGVARRVYENSHLTGVGQVLGTPNYMSPEQAAGEASQIGPAADVYSLGAVLYTMLTGRPPFECNRVDMLVQVLEHEPVAPRRLNLCVPLDLETICLKCLSKEPHKRYASAAELARDLARFLANEPIRAKPAGLGTRGAKWVQRQPGIAAAGVFVAGFMALCLTGACWQWRRAEAARADATEKLHSAYHAQAQASRLSGRPGRRFASLETLRKAAEIRPSVELRNESIACLSLFDVEVEHTRPIDGLFGAPDFNKAFDRVAYSDKQGTIIVRGWPDGEERCRLAAGRPTESLRHAVVRFSPDGKQLAVAMHYDATHELSLWNLEQGRSVLSVPEGIHALALDFSADGSLLAAGRPDGTLALYETATGKQVASWTLGFVPHTVRLAPRGSVLAASGATTVKLLDYESGIVLQSLQHPETVRGVAWSPDGELVATGCGDHRVYLWHSQTGERQRTLEGHRSAAVHVFFNHRGNLLVSHGWDDRTQVWDVRTGAALARVPGLALAFRADDRELAFSGSEIGVWRVAEGRERRVLQTATNERLWYAEIDAESRLVALARQDGVRFWDLASGAEVGWLDIGPVRLASFEQHGGGLITWGAAGLIRWPLRLACRKTGKLLIGPPQPLGLSASNLPEFGAISRDGHMLAAADRSYGELFIYDLIKRQLLFRGPHANPSRIAISPDGAWVVGGTWSDLHPAVRRWNTQSQEQVDHWPGPNGTMLAFSPNGRWLWAGASQAGRLVDAKTWETIRSSRIEAGGTGAGIFSPDSSMLAVNTSSDRVHLIDPLTGEEIASFEASIPLCFNREGNLLLTQQDDQTVHLWDLAAIRRQLAGLNLDWSGPPLPPSPQHLPGRPPLRIQVLNGQTQ